MGCLISVIVPVYMVEEYLNTCIESIITQDYKNLEVILIDDGTKDKSGEICDYYSKKEKRVITIHKENGGLSSARNTGIKASKGKYILFLDSDDYLANNNVISDMASVIEKNKTNLVVGSAVAYYSKGNTKLINDLERTFGKKEIIESEEYLLKCLKKSVIYAPATFYLYNREFLISNNLSFKEGIYHEDEEFTPRAILKAREIYIYKKSFYIYRQRENSIISTKNNKKGRDMLEIGVRLNELSYDIKNYELRNLFCDLISSTMIHQIDLYRFKKVTKKEKVAILKASRSKKFIIRAILININLSLYHIIEKIYRRGRGFGD